MDNIKKFSDINTNIKGGGFYQSLELVNAKDLVNKLIIIEDIQIQHNVKDKFSDNKDRALIKYKFDNKEYKSIISYMYVVKQLEEAKNNGLPIQGTLKLIDGKFKKYYAFT